MPPKRPPSEPPGNINEYHAKNMPSVIIKSTSVPVNSGSIKGLTINDAGTPNENITLNSTMFATNPIKVHNSPFQGFLATIPQIKPVIIQINNGIQKPVPNINTE